MRHIGHEVSDSGCRDHGDEDACSGLPEELPDDQSEEGTDDTHGDAVGSEGGESSVGDEKCLEYENDGRQDCADSDTVEDDGDSGSGGVGTGSGDGRQFERGDQEDERSREGDDHLLIGVIPENLTKFYNSDVEEGDHDYEPYEAPDGLEVSFHNVHLNSPFIHPAVGWVSHKPISVGHLVALYNSWLCNPTYRKSYDPDTLKTNVG